MDLDLRKIRYFVTVAERLSFVRSAAELHLTQPALSRQIQSLEHDLGVVLFVRDRRGTALTDPGRQLLEDARPLLASAPYSRSMRLPSAIMSSYRPRSWSTVSPVGCRIRPEPTGAGLSKRSKIVTRCPARLR